ncbi:hypothetical protein L210DRAFT_2662719 [Boletus edulis BED1]|uniref:Uncharacterized protein n=1 Tax=Boletus edulis BED1 TaxID=1328754 RepID=A0AAD4GLK7_BOLED|nr:hypothetical protein L210DRAFT_2662719 [Boletus edulis BED1]
MMHRLNVLRKGCFEWLNQYTYVQQGLIRMPLFRPHGRDCHQKILSLRSGRVFFASRPTRPICYRMYRTSRTGCSLLIQLLQSIDFRGSVDVATARYI